MSSHVVVHEFYKHDPLVSPADQIRLLQFTTAGIELSTWSIGETPSYIAISYAWGNASTPHRITIGGKSFAIGTNCYHALRQVQQYRPDKHIWIDAICINQIDAREKGKQVQRMGAIFATAIETILCVGPAQDGSQRLGDDPKQVIDLVAKWNYGTSDRSFEQHFLDAFERTGRLTYGRALLGSIVAFINRPYWSRLWIVQEAALAQTKVVLCGESFLNWEYINALQFLIKGLNVEGKPPSNFEHVVMTAFRQQRGISMTIDAALWRYMDFKCSDVRDRIYGVLSFIGHSESERNPLRDADYTLTPFDLLLRVVDAMKSKSEYVLRAMYTFGLDMRTPELQALVSYATHEDTTVDSRVWNEFQDCLGQLTEPYSSSPICRINFDDHGALKANFKEKSNSNGDAMGLGSTEFITSPRFQETCQYSKLVRCEESVVALVCTEAGAGDLLVSHDRLRTENLLVLRNIEGHDFRIVGQGLGLRGFTPAQDDEYRDKALRISLTSPEATVLWGQDFSGREARIGREHWLFDFEAQLRRLKTPVELSKRAPVRARLLEYAEIPSSHEMW